MAKSAQSNATRENTSKWRKDDNYPLQFLKTQANRDMLPENRT